MVPKKSNNPCAKITGRNVEVYIHEKLDVEMSIQPIFFYGLSFKMPVETWKVH